jgi:CO dehydrogenase nickel-insertion accessory protein CooC1
LNRVGEASTPPSTSVTWPRTSASNDITVVGNKVRGEADERFLRKHLPDFELLGFLPYDNALIGADLDGLSSYDVESAAKAEVRAMLESF